MKSRRPIYRLNRGRIATAAGGGAAPMTPAAFAAAVQAATSATKLCLLVGDLGVTDAGGGVASAWDDQTGNARHFLQVTGGAQPAIATHPEINSRVALTGDGTNDVMAAAAFTAAANHWVYIIFQPVSHTLSDGLYGASSAANRFALKQNTSAPDFMQQGNTATNVTVAPLGIWQRLHSQFGTTTADYITVGTETANANANVGTTPGTGRVLFAMALASNFGNMRIAMYLSCASKPTAPEIAAIDALALTYYGQAVFSNYHWINAPYWSDTDTSAAAGVSPNNYLTHEPLANVSFTTSDTSIDVTYVADSASYSSFGVYVNGAWHTGVLCTGDSVAHTVTVSLPAGAGKTVMLVEGSRNGGQTYIQSVVSACTLTPKTTAPAHRLMGYGDSIASGQQGTGAVVANNVRDSWPNGLRQYAPGRCTSYASGGRTLKSDADAGVIAAFIAKTIAILDGTSSNTLVSGIGTNDWGTASGAVWSAASFQTAMSAWVTGVLAGRPAAVIYLMTPIIRQDETDTNTFGDDLEDYRQAIRDVVTAAALPAQVILIEASAWLTLGDLVDGTHPSAAGYAIILANLKTALGY